MSTGQGPNEPARTDSRRWGAELTPGEAWRELGEYLGKLASDGRLLRPGDLVATVRRRAESGEPGWAGLLSQLHTEVTNAVPRQPPWSALTALARDPEVEVNTQARKARQNSDRYTEFVNQHQATRPVLRASAPQMRPRGTDRPMDGPTRRLGADRTDDAHGNSPQAPAGGPAHPRRPSAPTAGSYPPPATSSAVTGGGFTPSGLGDFGPNGGGTDADSDPAGGNGQHADDPGNGVGGDVPQPVSGTLPAERNGAGNRPSDSAGQQRASFLQAGEPDEIFGTDERTPPPVIGE